MKYLTILTLIVIVSACEFDVNPEFYVDPRLEPYVTAFYHEAEVRGIQLSKDHLVVKIEHIDPRNYGESRQMGSQRIVLISATEYTDYRDTTFYSGDTLYHAIENLMFHELGHALLNRPHCDPCYSIMNSTISLFEYSGQPEKRKLLIDELFSN